MSKTKIRICCTDKKQYTFCPRCNGVDAKKPPLYFAFCSENCSKIFQLVTDYRAGEITPVEAKEKLDTLDLSNKENFTDDIKKAIDEIQSGEDTEKSTRRSRK